MTSKSDMYAKMPTWLQNVVVSAYGLRLRFQRYGRGHREELDRLRNNQWLPRAALEEIQLSNLNAQLRRARALVSFYRERSGIPDRDLRSLEELRELPRL